MRHRSCWPSAISPFTSSSVAAYFASKSVTCPISRAACRTDSGVISCWCVKSHSSIASPRLCVARQPHGDGRIAGRRMQRRLHVGVAVDVERKVLQHQRTCAGVRRRVLREDRLVGHVRLPHAGHWKSLNLTISTFAPSAGSTSGTRGCACQEALELRPLILVRRGCRRRRPPPASASTLAPSRGKNASVDAAPPSKQSGEHQGERARDEQP